MSAGIFNEGRAWIANKAFRNQYVNSTFSLGLYTNTPGTLSHRNVLADIVACAGSGYAPLAISPTAWSVSIVHASDPMDDAVDLSLPDQILTASSDDWGVVTGAYLFHATGGIAIGWRDMVDAAGVPISYAMPVGAKSLVRWINEVL